MSTALPLPATEGVGVAGFVRAEAARTAEVRGAQQGFVLLELIVAGLLLTLLAVWGSQSWMQRVRDAQAQALAAWMLAARTVAHDYLVRHGAEMVMADQESALAAQGYLDWSQPAWAELKAGGLARPGFPELGALGMRVGVRILRHGVCPGEACRLEALVHTMQPVLSRDRQRVDEGMIAQWLMAAQGLGAVVWEHSPDVLAGPTLRHPNPLPGLAQAWPAGVVALSVSLPGAVASSSGGSGESDDFLRVGDVRNPDFQGSATVQGDIATQSSLRAQRYLVLQDRNSEFQACVEGGALSVENFHDGLLLCRGNIWRSAGRAEGGGFSSNSRFGCANREGGSTRNPATGGCFCGMGYVPVQVSDSGPDPQEGRTLGFLCVGN